MGVFAGSAAIHPLPLGIFYNSMKPEELKSKINFSFKDDGPRTRVTATLVIGSSLEYDRREIASYNNGNRAIDEIKERLREEIIRELYEDQRRGMHDALMDLAMCNPVDFSAQAAAREKVFQMAKRQIPSLPNVAVLARL